MKIFSRLIHFPLSIALFFAATGTLYAEEMPESSSGIIDWGAELANGGLTVVALLVLLTAGVAFALERAIGGRENRIAPTKIFHQFKALTAKRDFAIIAELAAKDDSALSRIVAFISANHFSDFNQVATAAADIGSQEVQRHQQRAYLLMVVATAAPLLGLLGTIIGMIEAFQTVAIAGSMGDASILADSISKALITTAVGLIVAIPFLLLYHYFRYRISVHALTLEKQTTELVFLWFNQHPSNIEPQAIAPAANPDAS